MRLIANVKTSLETPCSNHGYEEERRHLGAGAV